MLIFKLERWIHSRKIQGFCKSKVEVIESILETQ